ncbi:hypothetical protein SAMN04488526_3256 [Jannaschia helgolandensis]|uniref:Uncharacterized protein n=2 Tax=Jannaschia helgolandensis TaxID=188906 RepID=A0A1H7S6K1_9RHOB|nr:hypothetical protein SAMN04488526_3256 [Jannaschia helgolandensis]
MIERETSRLGLPYLRIRLEDVDGRLDEVAKFLGIKEGLNPRPPANLKLMYRARPALDRFLTPELTTMAKRYGY